MELTQSLHRSAALTPDRASTVHNGVTRTFADSIDRVARFAAALRDLGIKPGDRVAILALNSDRFHEYLLAVPWVGGVVVPLNLRWNATEVSFAITDSGADVLVVDDAFAPMIVGLKGTLPGLRHVVHNGNGETPEGMLSYETLIAETAPMEDVRRNGTDLYGIFYTGGTTGFPKGVMLTHDNMMASAYGTAVTGEFVSRNGRLLHAAPMFHLADIAIWMGGLVLENTHYFVPSFTPRGVAESIATNKITDMLMVPTMIMMILADQTLEEFDLSSMGHIIYGSSPLPVAALMKARERFPNATFLQAYGMTELAPVATVLMWEDHQHEVRRGSAGRAAPHTEVRIADEDGNTVPRGTVGEVLVRGGSMMQGYWNQPEESAKALAGGWMHTGDGAYMDEDGYIYVVDRIKDMIKTGAENVYSVEVESVLATHPSVAMCAVIGLPDELWGERVHAVVVLKPDTTVTLEELDALCRQSLAAFKTPRGLTIIDAMPLSGAGKILKRELREQV